MEQGTKGVPRKRISSSELASFNSGFGSQVTILGQVPLVLHIQRIFMALNGPLNPSRITERKHFLRILSHFTEPMHAQQKPP